MAHRLGDARVSENAKIEVDGLLRVAVEPEAG
jgi:hypothetical protein